MFPVATLRAGADLTWRGGRARARSGLHRAVPHHAEPRGGCSRRRAPRRARRVPDPWPYPCVRRAARSVARPEPGPPDPHHLGDARVPVPDRARMGGRNDRQRLAQPGGARARRSASRCSSWSRFRSHASAHRYHGRRRGRSWLPPRCRDGWSSRSCAPPAPGGRLPPRARRSDPAARSPEHSGEPA